MVQPHPAPQTAWQRTPAEHTAAVRALAPEPRPERIPLPEATGRILARDVASPRELPLWDCSAMDGFAARRADLAEGVVLPVRGDVPAGVAPGPLEPGTAMRIMTGSPVPQGADTVVPVELTDIPRGPVPLPQEVRVDELPAGDNTRAAGSDVTTGQVVAEAGTVLDALTLGAVAAVGVAEVEATRPVRVRAVATGDELAPLGTEPGPGQLPDCNSWLVHGLATALGHPTERVLLDHDDPEELGRRLPELTADTDLLVFTGGVSAGAFEVVRQCLEPRGIEFGQVSMQPGKPQGVGQLDGVTVLCLPGNPVSAVVSFLAFARPWLDAASGREAPGPVTAVLGDGWAKKPGRTQYMPVTLSPEEGRLVARRRSAEGSLSHLASRLAGVDGFAIVPAAAEGVQEGDLVEVMMVP
ncbi:molybdopterin molybdotransferase [Kytococcus aerolatus]|uniref:Molybdopterin molybdenumtransferase n=1 Tax=Kytococcus aerolatus TaxID=592308 RepID=A0A212T939_9MICO|nr:gephyrin-like molybdotransferase Glp [Kytococcus aerolatus]SNC62314.1 molybdopterin molybdotransferase [Kytococcus aerolatus]